MKTKLMIALLLMGGTQLRAQGVKTDSTACNKIFAASDKLEKDGQAPRFEQHIGFAEKDMNWDRLTNMLTFKDTIIHDKINREKGNIRFVVRNDGSVDCIKIIKKGIRPDIDKKAINMINSIKFTPAKQKGQPVSADIEVMYRMGR